MIRRVRCRGFAAVCFTWLCLLLFKGTADALTQTPSPTPTRTPTVTPEGTITATLTPTPTFTATCAPTGTPYCSDRCIPCPTIRPNCYTGGSCGTCIQNPACDANEVCAPSHNPNISGCCSCATVTPTPTPCETFPPPTLTFGFSAEPAHPVVGDQVQLSFSVSGRGGLPAYTLSGATPVFQGDTSTVTSNQLGTVTYHLTAVQAGTATLTLSVNYETWIGCVGQPIYMFVNDSSQPFSVEVAERTSTPTPTPSVTCEPIAGLTDCQEDSDCVVVEQIGCCPCSAGGQQAAINQSKQAELSLQLEVCCAAAGVCLDVYLCEDNPAALCQSGTCALVNGAVTPTATPTPGACVGDCDAGGTVTIDEIIRMVVIALNGEPANAALSCPGVDQWCNTGVLGVTIDCIIVAVNNALYGCSMATPTSTPA